MLAMKEIRERLGLTQAAVARELGVSRQTYNNWELGKRQADYEYLLRLGELFETSVENILTGCLEPTVPIDYNSIAGAQAGSKPADISSAEKNHIEKYRSLDDFGKEAVDSVLDVEHKRCMNKSADETSKPRTITIWRSLLTASAGAGEYLIEGNYEPREFPDTPQARQADVVIPVSGRSMEPLFHDGDELYVRKQPSVEIGEIGIFIKNGEGFVKEAGEGRLISLNPEFDDIYTNGEPIVCFGKVLGKVERGEDNG